MGWPEKRPFSSRLIHTLYTLVSCRSLVLTVTHQWTDSDRKIMRSEATRPLRLISFISVCQAAVIHSASFVLLGRDRDFASKRTLSSFFLSTIFHIVRSSAFYSSNNSNNFIRESAEYKTGKHMQ